MSTNWPTYFRALHQREDVVLRALLDVGTPTPRAKHLAHSLVVHPLEPIHAARLLLRAAERVRQGTK